MGLTRVASGLRSMFRMRPADTYNCRCNPEIARTLRSPPVAMTNDPMKPSSCGGKITFCRRMLPGQKGQTHPVVMVLRSLGFQVTPTGDRLPGLETDLIWIQGNTTWFPNVCRDLTAIPGPKRPFVVHWLHEPLPPPVSSGLPAPRLDLRELAKVVLHDRRINDIYSNYSRLRRLVRRQLPDLLVASTQARCEFLAERGIEAHWVPLGYEPGVHGRPLGLTRDIEVLYLGVRASRRRRVLRQLRRGGVPLRAMGSWFDHELWGSERAVLLNRSKIFLNIAHYHGELPGERFLLGMANKALVVSEPVYRPAPYTPERHYVSCGIDEMPGVINHYLGDHSERDRIVDEAYDLVSNEVTLSQSVRHILRLLGERNVLRKTIPAGMES